MKVLGLIGTLDPYKHKLNQGSIEDASVIAKEKRVKYDPSKQHPTFSLCDFLCVVIALVWLLANYNG